MGGGGRFVTEAMGGGGATDASMQRLPRVVDTTAEAQAGADQSMVFADVVQRDDRQPVSDIKFVTFTGGDQEIVLVRNTGGFMRMRPTVGIGPSTPGDPKVLEEVLDGTPLDCAGPADATAGAANLRLWVVHNRKRSAVKLSDHSIVHAEERADFNVTGDATTSEEPYGLAFDETNSLLYTVTKQGGVYAEDTTAPDALVETASIDLSGYFLPGEYLIDVAVWNGVGEEVVVVLSTQRLFTLDASTLAVLGQTTTVGVWGTNATFSALVLTTLDKLVVHKNATGDVVAFVQVQARGYEIAPQTRPFGRVIVACDLDLAGGYSGPTFTTATPRVYNPYPTAPSGWAAYLASNPSLDKTDFSVWDFALADNGGTNYLYVCHGKMRQVRRLTVTNVLGAGFTVGAIIPCHPNYSATPASNTAERIVNIAVDPADYERFIIFEYETSIRVVVLNAGLETVNTNNAHASEVVNKGAAKRVPVMLLAGPLTVAWMFDLYQVKYVRKGFSFETANPVLSVEKFWTYAMDGIAPVPSLDAVYTLTFGGVIPYTRATSSDPFQSLAAGYQPSFGNDGVHADRHSNTEQIDALEDFPTPGDVSLVTACGEGGFMFYTVNTVSKAVNAPDFVPQPAEYAAVVGGPLDGWTNSGPGDFYSNNALLRVIDGETYVLQDITNFVTQEWALLAWRYNAGTWDFVTAVVVPTNYSSTAIPLTFAMHVTEDLSGRQFCFIGTQRSGSNTADGHLMVFRIDQLTASDTITLVEQHDLTGSYNKIGGLASSGDTLFVAVRAPTGTAYTGRVVSYDFDTLTGVVDINNPKQAIDAGQNTLPEFADWKMPWCLRFLQTDAGTGAGILCLGSSSGTYVEFGYDPANGSTATATFTSNIQPNGYDGFAYWTYNEAGSSQVFSTAPQAFSSGSVTATMLGQATGLVLGTTYEVRVNAYHSRGPFANRVVVGSTVTFQTPASASTAPPNAVTLPPSNIGGSTARLAGRVNPNGEDTVAVFLLTGPSGQTTTTEQELGSGFDPLLVEQDVSGLTENSQYVYQIRATNHNNQAATGNAISFVTLEGSGTPVIVSVIFPTQYITLNGANCRVRFDPNGSACQIRVDWGTSSGTYTDSTDVVVTENDSVIDVPITGLSPSTQYFVRVSILSLEGLGSYIFPTETTFTTISTANAPTCLTALPTDIRDNSAIFNAYVDPNTVSTSVEFEYWDDETGDDPVHLTIPATATSSSGSQVTLSATALNLQPFHRYAVLARATNAAGSSIGQQLKFRTMGGQTGIALVVTTEPETNVTTDSAFIHGTLVTSTIPTTYYFEFWVTGSNKSFTRPTLRDFTLFEPIDPGSETVSALISGLTPSTTYNYRLVGISYADPAVQVGSTGTLTTLADPSGTPPAIGFMQQVSVLNATIVSCDGRVDDQGEDTYCTFEASTTTGFGTIAGSSVEFLVPEGDGGVTTWSEDITGLTASTAYYFRIKMIHQIGGVTSYSNVIGPISTNAMLAPTVTTSTVGGATPTTLIARGSVVIPNDPGTPDVFAWFEYGRSPQAGGTGYEVQGPESPLGSTAGTYAMQLQMGGPQTPAPLLPNTLYYYRLKARKGALVVMGAEQSGTTQNAPSASDPNPVALSVKSLTPYSFTMEGTVETNGSDTDVVFQYVDASDASGWASVNVVSRPAQTITDSTYTALVGDHTEFLGVANEAHTWLWRIKATNSTGSDIYSYGPAPVACPAPQPHPNFAPATVQAAANSVNVAVRSMKDMESARLRWTCDHNGQRMWLQMIWGTDPTLATNTKSRWVSYQGPTAAQINITNNPPAQGQMRYADYLTGLSANTTYYAQLVCWSIEGIHTSAIVSFTTFAVGDFSASWLASVGTRIPARCQMGPVPKDLRLGTGTRSSSSPGPDWGALTYTSAEDAYSIIVTPTSITFPFDTALNKSQVDSATTPNLSYAIRNARVGDKIWVDASYQGLAGRFTSTTGSMATGDIVAGVTTFGTASEWTAVVHKYVSGGNSNFSLRLLTGTLPTSAYTTSVAAGTTPYGAATFEDIQKVVGGVLSGSRISGVSLYYSGGYVYESPELGGSGGGFTSSPAAKVAYWGSATRRYPVTGLRILPKTAGTTMVLSSCSHGNDAGGYNGVFFRDAIITGLMTTNRETWIVNGQGGAGGVGILGFKNVAFKQYDPTSYSGYGVKQQFRGQSPLTRDWEDVTFTPSNEHSSYIDSESEISGNSSWTIRQRVVGRSADGLKTTSQRSLIQIDARGDLCQNTQTGPGYPPGRGTLDIVDCTAEGGTSAGAITIVGHFGTINITGFTHDNEPGGAQTRQSFVLQEDPGGTEKGLWRTERGYFLHTVTVDGYTANVTNEEDAFGQFRGIESLEIGDMTWTNPNNKALIELFELGLCDNGYVRFTGAGTTPGALFSWANWPTGVNQSNRIVYRQQGITSPTTYQELQDGKQFTTIN